MAIKLADMENNIFKDDILKPGTTYINSTYGDMLLGDVIGTNFVYTYFKQQFKDVKFYLVENDNLLIPIEVLNTIKKTFNGIDGIMTKEELLSSGITGEDMFNFPIWLFSSVINQSTSVKNMIDIRRDPLLNKALQFKNNTKEGVVSICPLVDVIDRNPLRNWSDEVVNGMIEYFLDKGYVVIGLRSYHNDKLKQLFKRYIGRENFIEVAKDLINSIRAITLSTWFIGGDTGLTHFVSNMGEYGPNNMVALYYKGSRTSYWKIDGWQINNYRNKYFNPKYKHLLTQFNNSSSPKISDEQILWLLMENHNMQFILNTFMDAESNGYKINNVNISKNEYRTIKEFVKT